MRSLDGIAVLVKPHPNGVSGNDEVFEKLSEKYKGSNIQFIDKNVSNLQILNSKPLAVVTAYGTAASEFAYHNIPVITIYDNPFVAFNFTKLLHTGEEYKSALLNIKDITVKVDTPEILDYYYMQHIYFFCGKDANWLKLADIVGISNTDEFLNNYMPVMQTEGYFQMVDSAFKQGLEFADKEFSDIIEGKIHE